MQKNLINDYRRRRNQEKLRMLMKLGTLFMFLIVFGLQLSALSQKEQLFTKEFENTGVVDVFKQIQNESDYRFIFMSEDVKSLKNVTKNFKNSTVNEILEFCLEDSDFGYEMDEYMIIIHSKEKEVIESILTEAIEINGKVTDSDGTSLPGATIMEKGTTNGIITDSDGNYTFTVNGVNSIIQISFIGFETQEITVGTQTTINIVLETSASSLEEVVVVGYGTQKKEQIGSAVSVVKSEEIEMKAIGKVNFEDALAGQIKGVQILKENGRPGARSVINIRGYTTHDLSNAASAPLFVIDGVQMFVYGDEMNIDNPLDAIDPIDIESITVLKDAGATAIYGSNGANGVIIVTTKGGRKNTKVNATANFTYSFNRPTALPPDPLNAEDFKAYQIMAAQNTLWKYNQGFGRTSAWRNAVTIIDPETGNVRNTVYDTYSGKDIPLFGNADTDWRSLLYKNYSTSKVMNINVNGGSEKTTYSLTASYTDSEPLLFGDYYKKYGLNLRLDSEVNNWLKIGVSSVISATNNYSQGDKTGFWQGYRIINQRPDMPVYNEDGYFLYFPYLDWGGSPGEVSITELGSNPVARNSNPDHSKTKTIISTIYAEAKLFKGFTLRTDASVFSSTGKLDLIRNQEAGTKLVDGSYSYLNRLTKRFTENLNTTFDIRGNYHVKIKDHMIDAMFGVSWFRTHYTNFSQQSLAITDPYVLNNASSAESTGTIVDSKRESAMNSFYSRLQYSYKGKYTATLNFRSDKSSKFGPGNKIAYFPAVAFNWNIAGENFMDNADFVNRLSLRTSYGKTGSTNVEEFAYLQVFQPSTDRYQNSYEGLGRALQIGNTLPNKEIGWESTSELNIGIDFSLFNKRVYGSFDIYSKQTKGVLGPAPYRLETGAGDFTANLADIDNKGWEFEIGVDIIRSKDIRWTADFNIAKNSAIRGAYHGMMSPEISGIAYLIGEPLISIVGYRVEGIIQTKEEIDALNAASPTGRYYKSTTGPGDYKFKDLNGDGRITTDDREIIGDREPDFFGGFNTMFRYKNFSLMASFQYAIGMSLGYYSQHGAAYMMNNTTTFEHVLTDTWRPDNTGAQIPMKVFGYGYNDLTLSDASLQNDVFFIKVNSIRLNYEIPEALMNKSPFKNAMVYVVVSNPFIFTNFKAKDPTTVTRGGAYRRNGGYNYPTARTIALGVKIGL